MPLLTWSEEFEIGVEEVDEQHRRLFEVINDLHAAMKKGRGREEVGDALRELEVYVEYHFDSERDLSVRCGFSDDCAGCHRAHQQAHDAFEQKVAELRESHEEGNISVPMETMQFVQTWVTEHVGGMDQQLGEYINDEVSPEKFEPIEMTADG